jgi:hypothetical protein
MLAIGADMPAVRDPEAFVRLHVDQFLRGASARTERPPAGVRKAPGRRAATLARRRTTRQPA